MKRAPTTQGPALTDLPRRHEALVVLDIDEVVIHFIEPFRALLEEQGARLHVENFRLTGNVRSLSTGVALTGHELDRLTERLYEEQEARQGLVEGVREAIDEMSGSADIVFLTAMTPSFYPVRRRHLDASGLEQPMIATERSKGAVVAEMAVLRTGPIVFVDDLPPNLLTVGRSVPGAHLVHLMASETFRAHLPPLPPGAVGARDWPHARQLILQRITGAPPLPDTAGGA
ncbi:hypothetical protein ASG43_08345 [Aureimonas sp. Leaf454]|uniref:hypothetical protein n=1 Tax=Aureimonas sp. Leaf454 TaxID=1736381 RepID=UPI0006F84EFB|nr:hypothetical protein [Aureimonas sp. Leaf454]KQT48844.1 hypothetical protein ASG43_08345 [Aureimonas sp. Leaf454]